MNPLIDIKAQLRLIAQIASTMDDKEKRQFLETWYNSLDDRQKAEVQDEIERIKQAFDKIVIGLTEAANNLKEAMVEIWSKK